jgi:hypothetical protein
MIFFGFPMILTLFLFSQSVLHDACVRGHVKLVQLLLTRDDLQLNLQDPVRKIISLTLHQKIHIFFISKE